MTYANWRDRKRADLRQYEAMRWDTIPWRARLAIVGLYPRRACRLAAAWFREVTALPGDEFYDWARERHLMVRTVKPTLIVCDVLSREAHLRGLPAEHRTFARHPFGWWV